MVTTNPASQATCLPCGVRPGRTLKNSQNRTQDVFSLWVRASFRSGELDRNTKKTPAGCRETSPALECWVPWGNRNQSRRADRSFLTTESGPNFQSSQRFLRRILPLNVRSRTDEAALRSEEHTSELQSRGHLVC